MTKPAEADRGIASTTRMGTSVAAVADHRARHARRCRASPERQGRWVRRAVRALRYGRKDNGHTLLTQRQATGLPLFRAVL
jgi:hypothetical protein